MHLHFSLLLAKKFKATGGLIDPDVCIGSGPYIGGTIVTLTTCDDDTLLTSKLS